LSLFEKAAELRSDKRMLNIVNANFVELLATFTSEQQSIILKRLRKGKERIESDINDQDYFSYGLFDSIPILKEIAKK